MEQQPYDISVPEPHQTDVTPQHCLTNTLRCVSHLKKYC
jgi:hypothetical protein